MHGAVSMNASKLGSLCRVLGWWMVFHSQIIIDDSSASYALKVRCLNNAASDKPSTFINLNYSNLELSVVASACVTIGNV